VEQIETRQKGKNKTISELCGRWGKWSGKSSGWMAAEAATLKAPEWTDCVLSYG